MKWSQKISTSILVRGNRWLVRLCRLHDGFNGAFGLRLSHVPAQGVAQDGQLPVGFEASAGVLDRQHAGGGPTQRHLAIAPGWHSPELSKPRASRAIVVEYGAAPRAPARSWPITACLDRSSRCRINAKGWGYADQTMPMMMRHCRSGELELVAGVPARTLKPRSQDKGLRGEIAALIDALRAGAPAKVGPNGD